MNEFESIEALKRAALDFLDWTNELHKWQFRTSGKFQDELLLLERELRNAYTALVLKVERLTGEKSPVFVSHWIPNQVRNDFLNSEQHSDGQKLEQFVQWHSEDEKLAPLIEEFGQAKDAETVDALGYALSIRRQARRHLQAQIAASQD